MKKLKITDIFLLLLFISTTTYSQVNPENGKLREIRGEIIKMVSDSIIPSMAIAVVKDGVILWQEAIGYKDIGKKKLADVNSIYPLGSVSKSITATGIMQMINAKILDLQQDIRPLLYPIEIKDTDGNVPEIKLWQLVSMNAGINHGYGVFDNEEDLPLDANNKKKFYEETTIVAFEPGMVYEYSNRAFYLAEVIIENKSKISFQDYMNKNVFYPLGMKNTYAYMYQNKENEQFVKKYSSKGLKELESNISYPAGGSGLWSSIADMTNYAMFHLGDKKNNNVIDSANLKLMHEFRQGPADLFGIGWFNNGNELYSNGNVGGGNAAISINKENRLAIICLLNKTSWDGLADQYLRKIEEAIIGKSDNDGYKIWQRIYGTPFRSKYELIGKWKGIIKEPLTLKTIPVELTFNDSNKIYLKMGAKSIEIKNPTYNLFEEFEGEFNSVLRSIYDEETRCGLKLKHKENKLSGYIQYDNNVENRFYRLPLFIDLEKS